MVKGRERKWGEEMLTTTAIGDYLLDSVLATEGVLHGVRPERVAGPRLCLSMGSFRSGPGCRMWREIEVGQLGRWWDTDGGGGR